MSGPGNNGVAPRSATEQHLREVLGPVIAKHMGVDPLTHRVTVRLLQFWALACVVTAWVWSPTWFAITATALYVAPVVFALAFWPLLVSRRAARGGAK